MPNEDLKPIHTKLNHLHDRLPEGEFKMEVVTILQDLNKVMGVGGEEEKPKTSKTK